MGALLSGVTCWDQRVLWCHEQREHNEAVHIKVIERGIERSFDDSDGINAGLFLERCNTLRGPKIKADA